MRGESRGRFIKYTNFQGVGPSGKGLGLGGMLPSRSKVQHLLGANNSLGATPLGKKPTIYADPYRKTSETVVHRSHGISQGAHTRTPRLKKKKKKKKEYIPAIYSSPLPSFLSIQT
jgi:hypothetical protein